MIRSLSACLMVLISFPAFSFGEMVIDTEKSIIAVVTHKGGLAKGLAHNHLVSATQFQSTLSMEDGNPNSLSFQLAFKATDLSVDDPTLNQAWSKRIMELAILDEELSKPSAKDRGKIRKAMLSKKQLNPEKFPEIKAQVKSVAKKTQRIGNQDFDYALETQFTINGKTVTKTLACRMVTTDGLHLEVVGEANFSDFGIKPYSALLGAVSNQDNFHFFASLKAKTP